MDTERKQTALALQRLKSQEDRVTDAYIHEVMELARYKLEMERLRQRRQEVERRAMEMGRRAQEKVKSEAALQHLEHFCERVALGLQSVTFDEKKRLLHLVVERVLVEEGRVYIETIIPSEKDQLRPRHGEPVEPGAARPSTSSGRAEEICSRSVRRVSQPSTGSPTPRARRP